MTTKTLDEIAAAPLPARFDLVAEHLAELEAATDRARKLRDEAIKEYRASTSSGPTEIAKVARVSVSTVKAVLR